MKTALACLGIIILALVFGQRQSARIAQLENRIEYTKAFRTMKASHRAEREDRSDYRTKYARRATGATAAEVFDRVLPMMTPLGGNSMGPDAALQHRDAMQAMLQLDLKGIGELMSLVYQSKWLAKTWPMRQITAMLCLIAMTDSSPEAALNHMTEDKEWNRLFSPGHIPDDSMVGYVLARMAVDDPQRALDLMRKLENTPKALKDDSIRKLLWQITRRDPALALDAIAELPDADRERNYQMISYGLESDDERTVLFLAARDRLHSHPVEMKQVLFSFCDRFNDDNRSVAESKKWLQDLEMSESEKWIMAEGVGRTSGNFNPDPVTHARWMAEFLPPSAQRDELIFNALAPLIEADPAGIHSILNELGIGPEKLNGR